MGNTSYFSVLLRGDLENLRENILGYAFLQMFCFLERMLD